MERVSVEVGQLLCMKKTKKGEENVQKTTGGDRWMMGNVGKTSVTQSVAMTRNSFGFCCANLAK